MLFEVAAYDQGARVTYLGPSGSQIGHKESIKDTARVWLACMTVFSIAAMVRRLSKHWRNTLACRWNLPDHIDIYDLVILSCTIQLLSYCEQSRSLAVFSF